MDRDPRKGFITLLSSQDYLEGVIVLYKSLQRVNTKYNFIVAITDDLATEENLNELQKYDIIIEVVDRLEYSHNTIVKYKDSTVLNTASKLRIFGLKFYDKFVYIDADAIVLENIDELFDYPDGAMVKYKEENYGFSGLFVFCPRNHKEEYYIHLAKTQGCFDGDLLGDLWFVTRFDKNYHIPPKYFFHYAPNNILPIKAVHFCNHPKPWTDINAFDKKDRIIKIYAQLLQELQQEREK